MWILLEIIQMGQKVHKSCKSAEAYEEQTWNRKLQAEYFPKRKQGEHDSDKLHADVEQSEAQVTAGRWPGLHDCCLIGLHHLNPLIILRQFSNPNKNND